LKITLQVIECNCPEVQESVSTDNNLYNKKENPIVRLEGLKVRKWEHKLCYAIKFLT